MMILPSRITLSWLANRVYATSDLLGVDLDMVSGQFNGTTRHAIFVGGHEGDMLTPGYLSNKELAIWLAGVWLTTDKERTLKNARSTTERE